MIKKYEFDCNNNYWSNDPMYNYLFLASRQGYYNDYNKSYGFVPLYIVLKDLGFTPNVKDLEYILDDSDGFISFGISNQIPKRRGRHRKKYYLTISVKSIFEIR